MHMDLGSRPSQVALLIELNDINKKRKRLAVIDDRIGQIDSLHFLLFTNDLITNDYSFL